MTTIDNEQFVIEKLSVLNEVLPRNEEKAARSRAQYLSKITGLIELKPVAQSVSLSPGERLKEWKNKFLNVSLRKERSPMLTTLATIITVLALAFGGAGATVYAAQNSLPDTLLYPVKIASEDFRMNISNQAQEQFELSLEFANRRANEVAAMAANGDAVPQEVMTQLQNEFNNAFKLAAGMSDSELTPALLRIQATVRQQQQTMAGLGTANNEVILARIREMLQTQEKICEAGLADPLMFRIRVRQQQNGNLTPPEEQPTNTGPGEPQGNQAQGAGNSAGSGNGASTGSGNNGSGSGTCTTTDCVPVQDGTGPGPGPDAGNGEGSENSTPPQDGTGIGTGPNENPGSGGNTDTNPGSGNDNQNDQEETGNNNSDSGSSNPDNSGSNEPTTPGSGGSGGGGGGRGNP